MSFKRVNREDPCPVCGKPDWCLVTRDGTAAICARVQSDKPAGTKGAGWLHRLREDWQPPRWRSVKRVEIEKPRQFMYDIAKRNVMNLSPASLRWLGNELGVSVESLAMLRLGWSKHWNAYSFPMHFPSGAVSGIRYRKHDSKKFSEPKSKDGLFFRPESLKPECVFIVEGASDTAAVMDLGFQSVLGRASCRGNVEQVLTICRRLRPTRCVLIPDNDQPGIEGAAVLTAKIEAAGGVVQTITLPAEIKDVRQCVQSTKNAEWLAGELGKFCKRDIPNPRRKKR